MVCHTIHWFHSRDPIRTCVLWGSGLCILPVLRREVHIVSISIFSHHFNFSSKANTIYFLRRKVCPKMTRNFWRRGDNVLAMDCRCLEFYSSKGRCSHAGRIEHLRIKIDLAPTKVKETTLFQPFSGMFSQPHAMTLGHPAPQRASDYCDRTGLNPGSM